MVGPETQKAADWLFSADTNIPYNQGVYTCLLNKQGGIEADMIVTPIQSGTGTQADPIFKVLIPFLFYSFKLIIIVEFKRTFYYVVNIFLDARNEINKKIQPPNIFLAFNF